MNEIEIVNPCRVGISAKLRSLRQYFKSSNSIADSTVSSDESKLEDDDCNSDDEEVTYSQQYYLKRILNPDRDTHINIDDMELPSFRELDPPEIPIEAMPIEEKDSAPLPSGLHIERDPFLSRLTRNVEQVSNVPTLFLPMFNMDVNEALLRECMRYEWSSVYLKYRCLGLLSRFRQAGLVCGRLLAAGGIIDTMFSAALKFRRDRTGAWMAEVKWSLFKDEDYLCQAAHANIKLMYRLALFILSSNGTKLKEVSAALNRQGCDKVYLLASNPQSLLCYTENITTHPCFSHLPMITQNEITANVRSGLVFCTRCSISLHTVLLYKLSRLSLGLSPCATYFRLLRGSHLTTPLFLNCTEEKTSTELWNKTEFDNLVYRGPNFNLVRTGYGSKFTPAMLKNGRVAQNQILTTGLLSHCTDVWHFAPLT